MKTGKGKKHLFAAPFGLLFLIALNLLTLFRFSYEWALYDIVNAIQCFPPFWVIPLLLIFLPQILILRSARKNTRLFAAELVLCVSALVIWFGPLPRLVNFALYRAQREEICENWDKWDGTPAVCAPCGRYRDETRGEYCFYFREYVLFFERDRRSDSWGADDGGEWEPPRAGYLRTTGTPEKLPRMLYCRHVTGDWWYVETQGFYGLSNWA